MKISEIARLAGVSPAAVSRYINGGSISEEKKQQIKRVIEETGYVPNPAARSLRRQSSDSVGIIVPKINSDSVSNLIEGVSSELSKSGFLTIFANAGSDEKREVEYLRLMQESKLSGIILMATAFTPQHTQFFRETTIPLIVCGQTHPDVTCVYHDDRGAACAITRLLLQKGRRKLAYIGADEKDERVGLQRRLGVEDAMTEEGLDPSQLLRAQARFNVDDGYRAMQEILDSGAQPDGVVAATDALAVGAIKALRERGFKVPEDIAVGGVDGSFAGAIITPALTTVQLYHRESGRKAAELLLSMIRHYREHPGKKLPVSHTMLGYTLIERESV